MEPTAHTLFLREYFRDPRAIGSVVPDSGTCIDGLLRGVPFLDGGTLVEFGSASGSVTRRLCRELRANSQLVCFESNPRFYDNLRKNVNDRRVVLTARDAIEASDVFRELRLSPGTVDAIISTLPCSNLPYDELLERSVLPWLKPDGVFVQYMHVLSYLKGFSLARILNRHFGTVRTTFIVANIPPVLIYHCTPRVNAPSVIASAERDRNVVLQSSVLNRTKEELR